MKGPGRQPRVSDDEIIEVFRRASDPVLTTKEVADEVDIGHRGTFDRLQSLADGGKIRMKKVGESGAVWWVPDPRRD
jgi:hypothetical protein